MLLTLFNSIIWLCTYKCSYRIIIWTSVEIVRSCTVLANNRFCISSQESTQNTNYDEEREDDPENSTTSSLVLLFDMVLIAWTSVAVDFHLNTGILRWIVCESNVFITKELTTRFKWVATACTTTQVTALSICRSCTAWDLTLLICHFIDNSSLDAAVHTFIRLELNWCWFWISWANWFSLRSIHFIHFHVWAHTIYGIFHFCILVINKFLIINLKGGT